MPETIGNVVMDLTWYPGTDLYSDGAIEDELLQIVKTVPEEKLGDVIAQRKDWALLYHLSSVRERIVAPLPLEQSHNVLEIGAGCGAITGALARRAGAVTCIDLSKKRSLVNACRHRDLDNLRIIVGNFQEIAPHLTERYDYITLIGVFEYAISYIGGAKPYETFLTIIRRLLKPGGHVVIAIENRLGLKYWAGCREDHTGRFFEGLENYPDPAARVHTFSRQELFKVCQEAGFTPVTVAYPYPDYKLPLEIFTDDYLPQKGQLRLNNWNFDRDRVRLFDETAVMDSLIDAGLFGEFSNSFLLDLCADQRAAQESRAKTTIYQRFSDERSLTYALDTRIVRDQAGTIRVVKTAHAPEGNGQIDRIQKAQQHLETLFADQPRLQINKITAMDTDGTRHSVTLEYVPNARSMEQEAGVLLRSGRREEAVALIGQLTALVRSAATVPFVPTEDFLKIFGPCPECDGGLCMPVTDLDFLAENVLLEETGEDRSWVLIDYEWTFAFPIPADYIIWRIWHYLYARYLGIAVPEERLKLEQITPDEAARFARMEENYQAVVLGGCVPLRELYPLMSPGIKDVGTSLVEETQAAYLVSTLTCGAGRELEKAQTLKSTYRLEGDGTFRVTFSLEGVRDRRYLRWDPLEDQVCKIKITGVIADTMPVLVPLNGFREHGEDTFWTVDPAYEVVGDMTAADTLTIEGTMTFLSFHDQLATIHQMKTERDAYLAEMNELRTWVGQTKATFGYRGVEGLRRGRNYVMARVRGLPLFRDPEIVEKLYRKWYAAQEVSRETLAQQRLAKAEHAPLISLLLPAFRTPEKYLRAMIDSVLAQSYTGWELCIADGSEDGSITGILEEYAAADSRIRFRTLEKNLGISGNTNAAADLARGDYYVLVDHDDLLTPDALYEIARGIVMTGAQALYTDEDKVNMEGTELSDPNLKPDFSPDLLRSHNYITHLFAVSAQLFHQVGGFRPAFDGAQDYDLILRCCEQANKVVHIPRILYHWRCHPGSTAENPESKLYAYEAGRHAVEEHLARTGLAGTVTNTKYWGLYRTSYALQGDPMISVIIPNKDHVEDLDRCVRSLISESDYQNFEILVVENNSQEPATFRYYQKLARTYPQVRVLRWQHAFNYAAINNFAAGKAKGELLLLLNNDTKLILPGSLREMASLAMRSGTGCVGAKLLFADRTVQHAGIILGPGGFAGHVFSGIAADAPGYMMRPLITGNYCAVTAACLMVRARVYAQVAGMTEAFAVALNDVDFCLKVYQAGYVNVFTPYASWYHYESKSRGYETTPEKQARFQGEVALFRERWGELLDQGDPYYNANFDLKKPPFQWW